MSGDFRAFLLVAQIIKVKKSDTDRLKIQFMIKQFQKNAFKKDILIKLADHNGVEQYFLKSIHPMIPCTIYK